MSKFPVAVLAIPLGLIILGLGIWSYVQSTPQYSLYEINLSLKNKDFNSFEKYADIDTTFFNIYQRSYREAQAKLSQTDCQNINNFFKCLIYRQVAPPQSYLSNGRAKEEVKQKIKGQIESGKAYDSSLHLDNLYLDLKDIPVTYDKGMASVNLHSDTYGDLNLKLREQNGVWRVVDVTSNKINEL